MREQIIGELKSCCKQFNIEREEHRPWDDVRIHCITCGMDTGWVARGSEITVWNLLVEERCGIDWIAKWYGEWECYRDKWDCPRDANKIKVRVKYPTCVETMRRLYDWVGKTNDSEWHGIPANNLQIIGFNGTRVTDNWIIGYMTIGAGCFNMREWRTHGQLDFATHIDPLINEALEEG